MRIQAIRQPTRCAYCHDDVGSGAARCPLCETACHRDCMTLGGCPTLGCAGPRIGPRGGSRRRHDSRLRRRVLLWLCALAALGVLVCIAIPNNIEHCRGPSGETRAILTLRELGAAQALFREGDKDADRFRMIRSKRHPEFRWAALAVPTDGSSDRVFFTNQEGGIYSSSAEEVGGLLVVDSDTCEVPPGFTPVGSLEEGLSR